MGDATVGLQGASPSSGLLWKLHIDVHRASVSQWFRWRVMMATMGTGNCIHMKWRVLSVCLEQPASRMHTQLPAVGLG